jgi:hypothetical protein
MKGDGWHIQLVKSDAIDDSPGPYIGAVNRIVVHHCSLSRYDPIANPRPIELDDDLDATGLIERFKNPSLGTGGRTPYHLLVRTSGKLEQLLPLSVRGAHARKWNVGSVAVCVAGESRPAEEWQKIALVNSLCVLMVLYGLRADKVLGHCELDGASKDPGKKCPWPTVDMDQLRIELPGAMPSFHYEWDNQRREFFARRAGFVL